MADLYETGNWTLNEMHGPGSDQITEAVERDPLLQRLAYLKHGWPDGPVGSDEWHALVDAVADEAIVALADRDALSEDRDAWKADAANEFLKRQSAEAERDRLAGEVEKLTAEREQSWREAGADLAEACGSAVGESYLRTEAEARADRLADALSFAVRSASRRHDGKYEMHPSVYAAMQVALSDQPESEGEADV